MFSNKVTWIGFAIPLLYFSCTGFHHFYPSVPEFRFWWPAMTFWRDTVSLPIAFSYAWIGFFYLVNLEISFSI